MDRSHQKNPGQGLGNSLGEGLGKGSGAYNTYYATYYDDCIADLDSSGDLVRSYTYGPGIDNPLAMTTYSTETNTYYYLTDHLGSVLALTDEDGQIVESYQYDAFGRIKVFDSSHEEISESAYGNRITFQGREYSWATGLYYFRARWYEPVTGRWLSKDPIGISGGLNQYVAFGGNPVLVRDAFGLAPKLIGVASDGSVLYSPDVDWGDNDSRWGGRGAGAQPDSAGAWHYARNRLNRPASSLAEAVANWHEMSPQKSIYHRMGPGNENNRKFISPDGRHESVFRGDFLLDECTDPVNMGTYNRASPNHLWGIPHVFLDVLPYYSYGNTFSDPTTFYDRLIAGYDGGDERGGLYDF